MADMLLALYPISLLSVSVPPLPTHTHFIPTVLTALSYSRPPLPTTTTSGGFGCAARACVGARRGWLRRAGGRGSASRGGGRGGGNLKAVLRMKKGTAAAWSLWKCVTSSRSTCAPPPPSMSDEPARAAARCGCRGCGAAWPARMAGVGPSRRTLPARPLLLRFEIWMAATQDI
jgi:hypothetical protein